jgi:uncharacterized protein (DUF362 family)
MHNGQLHQNIADLVFLLPPQLTVIDGMITGKGYEMWGRPVPRNLVIAGVNSNATDARAYQKRFSIFAMPPRKN